MHTPESITKLVEKYLAGTATEMERKQVNDWYHSFNDEETEIDAANDENEQAVKSRIKDRLQETLQLQKQHGRRKWILSAAAVILVFISAGIYRMISSPAKTEVAKNQLHHIQYKNDIAPGGDKAVLTLADGSVIVLDNASNGAISQQGTMKVLKLNDGHLAYAADGKVISPDDPAYYNTITTPKGGQYQVTLSDGTKVWLNAASSIRFPVLFKGNERKVEITGEAYFEVAKNREKPFRVVTSKQVVEVLGTHFNINSYDDEEDVKTTLLEGLVKISPVSGNTSSIFIQPGQQARFTKTGDLKLVDHADTEEAIAWINGKFQFKSADIKSIMRQLARWYDVDVEYKGQINLHFTGQLNRKENVSKLFEQLGLTGEVNFQIEGKKVIITP